MWHSDEREESPSHFAGTGGQEPEKPRSTSPRFLQSRTSGTPLPCCTEKVPEIQNDQGESIQNKLPDCSDREGARDLERPRRVNPKETGLIPATRFFSLNINYAPSCSFFFLFSFLSHF